MRKFAIKVNDKSYEVEVEEIKEAPAPVVSPSPSVKPAARPVPAAKPAPALTKAGKSEGLTVNSPMPGTIISIEVKAGDTVKQGQVLMILEAMKMENEIPAPAEGKVVSISVTEGTAVNSGDLLLVLK